MTNNTFYGPKGPNRRTKKFGSNYMRNPYRKNNYMAPKPYKTCLGRVNGFSASYNTLYNLCNNVFGVDKHNPIKKFAHAIQWTNFRNDNVFEMLSNIVLLKNTFLSHDSVGIGVIPNPDYIFFLQKMKYFLLQNKEELQIGYAKFVSNQYRKRY